MSCLSNPLIQLPHAAAADVHSTIIGTLQAAGEHLILPPWGYFVRLAEADVTAYGSDEESWRLGLTADDKECIYPVWAVFTANAKGLADDLAQIKKHAYPLNEMVGHMREFEKNFTQTPYTDERGESTLRAARALAVVQNTMMALSDRCVGIWSRIGEAAHPATRTIGFYLKEELAMGKLRFRAQIFFASPAYVAGQQ